MNESTHGVQGPLPFRLPPGAEYYVVLQRASYQFRPPGPLGRGRPHRIYQRLAMRHVERLRRSRIAARYSQEIFADYRQIRPWLPTKASAVLDIGSGMGGIDVYLHRHFQAESPDVHIALLDKEGVSGDVYYGLQETAAFYSSLQLAGRFVTTNGVPQANVSTHDADVGYPDGREFDVIVSLLSWGHHYPIDTYLDDTWTSLAADGVLILDVRHGSGGIEELEGRFGDVQQIADGRVSARVAVRK